MTMSSTRFLLIIGLAIHLVHSFADDDVPFTSQPQEEPYYVASGEEGPLLLCSFGEEYRDRKRYEHFWSRVIGSPRFITRNGQSFMSDDYTLVEDISSGTYNLKVKSVSFEKDNGKFFCSILDKESGKQKETRPANIVVVVPPGPPVITSQPEQPVKENDLVTFECHSTGGNPEPQFNWVFENGTSLPEAWYQLRSSSNHAGTTSSLLQWRVDANENGAFVICEIWNKALPSGEKKTVTSNRLNVLYPPRVHAGPASPYFVEEGERAELRCEAEGNPEPSRYEWIHVPTGESHSGAVWSFIAEKRLHGDFRCVAANSLDKSTSKLTVDVLYSPVVTVNYNATPAEGENVKVECSFDANPRPDSISWSGPNGFSQSGSVLHISSVNRSQSGNYTCSVVNSLPVYSSSIPVTRTGRASTFVNVRYLPGNAIISSQTPYVKVNERISLSCSTDDEGSPKASYKWIVPFNVQSGMGSNHALHLPQLVIDNATLEHSGIYKCIPYNDLGYGVEANFRVLIVEPPKIIRSTRPSSTFKSGDAVSLTCEATGYPAPRIIWKKDGIDLTGDQEFGIHWETTTIISPSSCEFCSKNVTSSLRFSAVWSDKGNYSCIAVDDTSGMTDERSAVIAISHAPKILNSIYSGHSLAASEIGSTTRLSCRVSARPEPTISWSRGTEQNNPQPNSQTSTVYGSIDEYESILQIENTEQSDLGEYICRATNGNGPTAEVSILLGEKRAPAAPENVRIIKKDTSWMMLGWQPGFDGGAEQHFELEYRLVNYRDGFADPAFFLLYASNTSKSLSLDTNALSLTESPFQTFLSHNLTGLLPLTRVQYRLRAVTAIGRSEWTPLTEDFTVDVEVSNSFAKPLIVHYNRNDQSITVEPTNVTTSCLMVYSGRKKNAETPVQWSSIDCFETTNDKIKNLGTAQYYMVRSCIRRTPFLCSAGSEIYVDNVTTASLLTYVIAAAAAVVSVVLICGCFFFLLRNRNSCMSSSKGNVSSSPIHRDSIAGSKVEHLSMPKPDTKNTIIHGSQTDSGVFTLRSAQDYSGKTMTSVDPSTETWSPHTESEHGYDFQNENFIQHSPVGYLDVMAQMPDIGFHDQEIGYYLPDHSFDHPRAPRTSADEHTDSDSASFSVDGSSRRVIKEIIV